MTISQTSIMSEIANGEVIPEGKLAYFRERQRNRLYDFIVSRFLEKERSEGLTKADIARRLNRRPEQITRWLTTPGNWTIDTISDLMLAICKGEMLFEESRFINSRRNYIPQFPSDVSMPALNVSTSTTPFSPITVQIEKHYV